MAEKKKDKEALIKEIKEKVEELLSADNISEAQKEKLIRQALKIIEEGKGRPVQ